MRTFFFFQRSCLLLVVVIHRVKISKNVKKYTTTTGVQETWYNEKTDLERRGKEELYLSKKLTVTAIQ